MFKNVFDIFLLFNTGYKVIFIHRTGSILPFTTGFRNHISKNVDNNFLSSLEVRKDGIFVKINSISDNDNMLKSELKCYNSCKKNNMILYYSYETVNEYLYLLELIGKRLGVYDERICFFLAAAVSDFYIPEDEVFFYFLV